MHCVSTECTEKLGQLVSLELSGSQLTGECSFVHREIRLDCTRVVHVSTVHVDSSPESVTHEARLQDPIFSRTPS